MVSNFSNRFETSLKRTQIKKKLEELEDTCSVKWYRNGNRFVIRKKIHKASLARVPLRVYVNGTLAEKKDTTELELSIAPAMNIKDFLIFIIPAFAIMMYTGVKMGADAVSIVITLGVITICVSVLSNVIARFTQTGKEIYMDTIDMLKRQLLLKEKNN